MASVRIVAAAFLAVILVILAGCEASPDSAGIVEMVNGLAYGNIPYGSVSGNLGNYVPAHGRASEYIADPRAPPVIAPLNPVGY